MADVQDKEQRTEEATPRRREDARERGQVALSTEFVAAIGLCAGFGALLMTGGGLVRSVADNAIATFGALGALGTQELDAAQTAEIFRETATIVLGAVCLAILPVTAVCALSGYAQVGFRIAPKAVELQLSKIDPLQGMRRIFSARSMVRGALALLKVVLITATGAVIAWSHLDEIVRVGTNDLGPLLAALGRVALHCTAGMLIVIVGLGLLDLLFQRFQHERDLRMTRQELKEEQRLTDGDPHVRARIRQIQRELARRRMLAEIPKATVVVTNPTHYAVALRYEAEEREQKHAAPVVVAKGVDHLARRIRTLAEEHGVLCHEDVPLARALYAQVQIGQEIPEELYAAVATVLSHVYRLRGRKPRALQELEP